MNHNLLLAIRLLLKNRFQTLLTIVGLSVAIFCFGICTYFVYGYLAMDQYYENHDRVVVLEMEGHYPRNPQDQSLETMQIQFPEVEMVFRLFKEHQRIYRIDEQLTVQMTNFQCDTTLRCMYNPKLLAGSWEAAEHQPNSMVLCESFARRMYGSSMEALGKQISSVSYKFCQNPQVYTVQAVVEDLAYNNTLMPFTALDAWILNDIDYRYLCKQEAYGSNGCYYRLLLREGTDREDFCERFNQAKMIGYDSSWTNEFGDHHAEVPMIASVPFDPMRDDNGRAFLWRIILISIPGILILLSALSNFFHLLISSIMMRRREYVLRRAHGAHTWDLWLMVSTQIVLVLMLVGICTLIITEVFSPWISLNEMSLDAGQMLHQIFLHLVALLLVGLLLGWLAVARIRKDSLQESLKTSTGRRPGRHIGRNVLIGWQMTVGFVFLVLLCGLLNQILLNEQVMYPRLTTQEKREIVRVVSADNGGYPCCRGSVDQLRSIPSIKTFVDSDQWELMSFASAKKIMKAGQPIGSIIHIVALDSVAMQMAHDGILEGRWFERPDEVMISAEMAEFHNLHVGDQVEFQNVSHWMDYSYQDEELEGTHTICGIIDNVSEDRLDNNQRQGGVRGYSSFYVEYRTRQNRLGGCFVFQSMPGQVEQMKAEIEALGMYDIKGGEYKWKSIDDYVRERNSKLRGLMGVFWLFTIIALIITLLGVFSAIMMDTSLRRKEMAIRKINGAKTYHIALRFCRLYIVLLTVSAAIAFPLTYLIFDEATQSYWRVFSYNASFYICIFLLMAVFVALTIGVQIWRIARINPAKIVKSE